MFLFESFLQIEDGFAARTVWQMRAFLPLPVVWQVAVDVFQFAQVLIATAPATDPIEQAVQLETVLKPAVTVFVAILQGLRFCYAPLVQGEAFVGPVIASQSLGFVEGDANHIDPVPVVPGEGLCFLACPPATSPPAPTVAVVYAAVAGMHFPFEHIIQEGMLRRQFRIPDAVSFEQGKHPVADPVQGFELHARVVKYHFVRRLFPRNEHQKHAKRVLTEADAGVPFHGLGFVCVVAAGFQRICESLF